MYIKNHELVNSLQRISVQVSFCLLKDTNISKKAADMITLIDLTRYLMYLAASDGSIEWSEAGFISEWLGESVTPEDITNFLNEHDICSEQFKQTVPTSIKVAVASDNKWWQCGRKDADSLAMMLLDIYLNVGKELINIDGAQNNTEVNDCLNYLDMLTVYIAENDWLAIFGENREKFEGDEDGDSNFNAYEDKVSIEDRCVNAPPKKGLFAKVENFMKEKVGISAPRKKP